MPRAKAESSNVRLDGKTQHELNQLNYFSKSADVLEVAEWDPKQAVTIEAILAVLAQGHTIMFGRTRDGGAVSIAISPAEKVWQRVYVHDVVEWDDAMAAVLRVARPKQLRVAGD